MGYRAISFCSIILLKKSTFDRFEEIDSNPNFILKYCQTYARLNHNLENIVMFEVSVEEVFATGKLSVGFGGIDLREDLVSRWTTFKATSAKLPWNSLWSASTTCSLATRV